MQIQGKKDEIVPEILNGMLPVMWLQILRYQQKFYINTNFLKKKYVNAIAQKLKLDRQSSYPKLVIYKVLL